MTQTENKLRLLASPLEIAQYAKEEEILTSLLDLYVAALTENPDTLKRVRRETRKILMKYRPVTLWERIHGQEERAA